MDKKLYSPHFNKDNLRISKNYRGITFTATAAKIYNTLLLDHIRTEVKKIRSRNQKSINNITDSDNALNHRTKTCKTFLSNNILYRFLKGI